MLQVKTDLHTHTLASMHAYGTVEENVRHGSEQGLEVLGITDHFSRLFYPSTDFAYYGNFTNYKALPPEWYGVKILGGAEADIVDLEGHLFGHDVYPDMPWTNDKPTLEQVILMRLDYVIASVHFKAFTQDAGIGATTRMYCNALQHPKVLMLGHVGRAGVPFDTDEVLLTAKRLGKMIEINAASMDYPEAICNRCREVAIRCAELEVPIAVNSDAHSSYYVGRYDAALKMLEEIHFPEALIGNRSWESLQPYLARVQKLK